MSRHLSGASQAKCGACIYQPTPVEPLFPDGLHRYDYSGAGRNRTIAVETDTAAGSLVEHAE